MILYAIDLVFRRHKQIVLITNYYYVLQTTNKGNFSIMYDKWIAYILWYEWIGWYVIIVSIFIHWIKKAVIVT